MRGKSFNIRLLIFIGCIAYLMQSLDAQPLDRWRAGSSKDLNGEVLSVYCFIETEDNAWSEAEKLRMTVALNRAQQWITAQANKWDYAVCFKTLPLTVDNTFVINQIPAGNAVGNEKVSWALEVLHRAGYRHAKQAFRKIRRAAGTKNMHLIIFAKSDGNSYAMRYTKAYSKKKYFLEALLLYQDYSNGAEMPLAAVIAHEILHLYGGWDLYTTYAQTADRHFKAATLYPNDIMLRVGNDLETLEVDVLTAWLLGWNTREEEIFEWFRPADFSR
ncbi:MAG: hypothetical protein KJ578_07555 [Bacteroidetes bacterium]|nr:hypothetical protein [Bacteroidota bacterium]MBU2557618.1 hypothetical protein [Bacteroidota bacterium]